MILSDRDILERLKKGDLVIEPLGDPDVQVQPASVDVRLGTRFRVFRSPHIPFVDPDTVTEDFTEEITIDGDAPDDVFIMHPGEFALGSTLENVKIPADLVARVEGRSSLGRLAIVVHSTAGFIDPGFEGHITLELANMGRVPVALRPGMRVAQIVIEQMLSPAERPYGHPSRRSKYQGQRGPVPSRIAQDRS